MRFLNSLSFGELGTRTLELTSKESVDDSKIREVSVLSKTKILAHYPFPLTSTASKTEKR